MNRIGDNVAMRIPRLGELIDGKYCECEEVQEGLLTSTS